MLQQENVATPKKKNFFLIWKQYVVSLLSSGIDV